MKKRYFYVVASFMRKDIANTWRKVDFTFMKDDGSALFPLIEAFKAINEGYSEIADPATIQFDNYIEISKEDYEAFNNLKNLVKVNNWQAFINDSIHEGMRVLKTGGTLIFKWNEQQIKVGEVLKAIKDYKPIFGHRTTIKNQTIWMAFMKK